MKKKIIKIVFVLLMAIVAASLSYKIFLIEKRRLDIATAISQIETRERNAVMAPPPPPPEDGAPSTTPAPTIIQVSPTDGLRVELNETTSWNTVLQLLFTLLASYLGVKLINKHVRD